ncbi:hypothetical protein D3C85_1420480 [compost metagenome]
MPPAPFAFSPASRTDTGGRSDGIITATAIRIAAAIRAKMVMGPARPRKPKTRSGDTAGPMMVPMPRAPARADRAAVRSFSEVRSAT